LECNRQARIHRMEVQRRLGARRHNNPLQDKSALRLLGTIEWLFIATATLTSGLL